MGYDIMGRWIQFFEGEKNQLSMVRLLAFMSYFPASYVVMRTCTETALGLYLGAYVLQTAGNKALEKFGGKNVDTVTPKSPKK